MLSPNDGGFMELIKARLEEAKKSLDIGDRKTTKYAKSIWVCKNCEATVPVEMKEGKRSFIAPPECEQCGAKRFKIERQQPEE